MTACEELIEAYKDLTPKEAEYVFDTLYEAKKENCKHCGEPMSERVPDRD